MKKYTTLFFDIDNTLLDFYASEKFAIKKLFKNHGLPYDDKTVSVYSKINEKYWKMFERGEKSKSEILVARFSETLSVLGEKRDAKVMSEEYFNLLSECHFKTLYAEDILKYLKGKGYLIYATTNGVSITQYKRINESGLKEYFDGIFVSETVGCQKPQKEYFDYVINNIPENDKSKILVIGDSMTSDIKGGKNAGLDTCWFDGYGEEKVLTPDYVVTDLKQLEEIL